MSRLCLEIGLYDSIDVETPGGKVTFQFIEYRGKRGIRVDVIAPVAYKINRQHLPDSRVKPRKEPNES